MLINARILALVPWAMATVLNFIEHWGYYRIRVDVISHPKRPNDFFVLIGTVIGEDNYVHILHRDQGREQCVGIMLEPGTAKQCFWWWWEDPSVHPHDACYMVCSQCNGAGLPDTECPECGKVLDVQDVILSSMEPGHSIMTEQDVGGAYHTTLYCPCGEQVTVIREPYEDPPDEIQCPKCQKYYEGY